MGGGTQMLVKGYKLSGVRETNSGDLVYNLVAIVNNAKLYTSNLLRIDLKYSADTHTKGNYVMNVLTDCSHHFTMYMYIKSSC